MSRPSLSIIAIAVGVCLLIVALFALLGDAALAQAQQGGPQQGSPLPDIGKNARTQVLGLLAGIFGIFLAVKALQHSGDRNVPGAAMTFVFFMVAAYMIFAPEAARNTLKAMAQSIFPSVVGLPPIG